MPKTIWKYDLPIDDRFELEMPAGARVLAVQEQFGRPRLWAEVDPSAEKVSREFITYGTGHPMQTAFPFEYCGTYQVDNGGLVFHVYEEADHA